MAYSLALAPLVLLASTPDEAARLQAADSAAPASEQAAPPETVTAELTLLHEEGKSPFNGVSTEPGMVVVKATIAGAETLAMIDLSTDRSLVDTKLVQQQGVRIGEPIGSIAWRGTEYERRRAHDVEVILDGQMRVTSDFSAIAIDRSTGSGPGAPGYVLGRGLVDQLVLMLALLEDKRFYAISLTEKWNLRTDDGAQAEFPYESGVITLDIAGQPVRLFVDLTANTGLDLETAAWSRLFGSDKSGPREIRFGPFTREVEADLLFTAPPVEGVDGVIGIGFLESFVMVFDGPAKRAVMMSAPTLSRDGDKGD